MPGSEHAALLERLKATAGDLVSLTSGVATSQLERRPSPREWSAAMVVAHLADAELVFGVRIKSILTEERPMLFPFDETAWTDRFWTVDGDIKETLNRWRVMRDHTVRLLESLEEAEWRRAGVHPQRGEHSMRQVVSMIAEHDRGHLDQLRRAVSG